MPKFTMPRFTTMSLAAAAAVALATITTASAQTMFNQPGAQPGAGMMMGHNAGGPQRAGEMCWVNTGAYREIDTHGYWKLCEPAASANAAAPAAPQRVVPQRARRY